MVSKFKIIINRAFPTSINYKKKIFKSFAFLSILIPNHIPLIRTNKKGNINQKIKVIGELILSFLLLDYWLCP